MELVAINTLWVGFLVTFMMRRASMRAAVKTNAEAGSSSMHLYCGPSKKWQGADIWVPV